MESLTESQVEKIRKIIDEDVPKSLKINSKSYYISRKKINDVRKLERKLRGSDKVTEGGLLPLAALIPLIFAGIGTTAGVATGIAKTVKDVEAQTKAQKEQERHNKAMEGKGLEENSSDTSGSSNSNSVSPQTDLSSTIPQIDLSSMIKSFTKKTNLDKESRKMLKEILQELSEAIDIKQTKDGSGLYLNPIKSGAGLYLNPT